MSGAVKDDEPTQPDDAGFEALSKQVRKAQIASLLRLAEIGRTLLRTLETLRAQELASARQKGQALTGEAAVKSEAAYQRSRRRIVRSIDASFIQAFRLMEQGDQPLQ